MKSKEQGLKALPLPVKTATLMELILEGAEDKKKEKNKQKYLKNFVATHEWFSNKLVLRNLDTDSCREHTEWVRNRKEIDESLWLLVFPRGQKLEVIASLWNRTRFFWERCRSQFQMALAGLQSAQ